MQHHLPHPKTSGGKYPAAGFPAAICHAACCAIGLRRIAYNPFTLIVKVLKALNVPNDLNDLKVFKDFIKCRTISLTQKQQRREISRRKICMLKNDKFICI